MSRPLSLALCAVAMLLLSSLAQATMIWIPVIHVTGAWWANTPASSTSDIFTYNPSAHGGAPLAAVRIDLVSDLEVVAYQTHNLSPTSTASGTVTVSGGFAMFDPSDPGTALAEARHTWSLPLTLAPGEDHSDYVTTFGPEEHVSTSVTLTTDLDRFVSLTDAPAYWGRRTTDYSAWTGDADVGFQTQFAGSSEISLYYGYDDGTPTTTPEPGTLLLLGVGLPALGLLRRRRRAE